MPRIQLPDGRQTFQDQVPGADLQTRSQGELGDAYANLGHAIQSIGQQVLKARVEGQAKDYSFTQENLDKVAIKDYGDKLKLTTQPGTNDYSTKMEDFIKQRSQTNVDNAPTSVAADAYRYKAEGLHTSSVLDAQHFENKRNAESYVKNIQSGIDLNQRLFLDSPDPSKYKETVDGINQQIDGTLDPEVAIKYKQQASQQLASSILIGLSKQEKYDTALQLLDSKNGESDVAQGLTGEQKAHFMTQLMSLKQAKSDSNMHLISQNVQDFQYSAMQNGIVDQGQLSKILSGLNDNKSIKPEERRRITDTLKTTVQASGEMQKLATMPTDQLMSYQPKIDTMNTFNVSKRAEIAGQIETYRDQLLKRRANDPLEEAKNLSPILKSLSVQAQGGDPNISKQYMDNALAVQTQLGVPRPRVSTQAEASFNSQQLLAAPSPAAADVVLQKLKGQYGDYLPKALDEMAKDKTGVTHDFVIASYLPNQQSRINAIDNVQRQKDINKNFTDSFHSPPDLKTPIAQISSDLQKAVVQRTNSADDLGAYNSFVKQIELESKKTLAQNPGLPPIKAVNQAYDSVVSKNFEMIPSARSTIMMPKSVNGSYNDPQAVESFVMQNSTQDAFKKMDVIVPPAFKNKDDWYNFVAPKARWVTNSALSGLQLVYDSSTSGRTLPLTDSKGKLIQMSFKEIMLNAPQLKQQQQQQEQSFKMMDLGGVYGK